MNGSRCKRGSGARQRYYALKRRRERAQRSPAEALRDASRERAASLMALRGGERCSTRAAA